MQTFFSPRLQITEMDLEATPVPSLSALSSLTSLHEISLAAAQLEQRRNELDAELERCAEVAAQIDAKVRAAEALTASIEPVQVSSAPCWAVLFAQWRLSCRKLPLGNVVQFESTLRGALRVASACTALVCNCFAFSDALANRIFAHQSTRSAMHWRLRLKSPTLPCWPSV